ncbi:E3 ubiquitin-protein ligase sspH2 [compost metagenome]
MTQAITTAAQSSASKLVTATDDFISARTPVWIRQASQAQIRTLRDSLNAHHASQARLRGLTLELTPLQTFAETHFNTLLVQPLPAGVTLDQLEWLRVVPRFGTQVGTGFPTYGYEELRTHGMLRLMRNFAPQANFYLGTGLVAPGHDEVLTGPWQPFVKACRDLDVGRLYQEALTRIFSPAAERVLADDKRSGLKLATEVAALKGDIDSHVQIALREVVEGAAAPTRDDLTAFPGLLTALGRVVVDGLYLHLRDAQGAEKGVVLYLPSDPVRALRSFPSVEAMEREMATALQDPAYFQYFSQLISLEHRADFVTTLRLRLKDSLPRLDLDGAALESAPHGDPEETIFEKLAKQQVQRVKDDARLLLISTADADSADVARKTAAWKAAGLDLVNLAGLFIPAVGAILLGQLVAQTLSEVFEGVIDWHRGHQHEALEHMLGVAETLAATAATIAGVTVVRSAFVEGMRPVRLEDGRSRLWTSNLEAYESTPEAIELGGDGRYVTGTRHWMRVGSRFYEVHRQSPHGVYRLRHPAREGAYGPVVLHNGDRSWRLMLDRSQQRNDAAEMLDMLWPQHPPIDALRAEHVLQVAGVDLDELRGLLVENRPLPVNLRETLRRFEADARIESFVAHLTDEKPLSSADVELLHWCETQPGIGNGLANVLEGMPGLRASLFEHLVRAPALDDPLQLLPGLPAVDDPLLQQITEAFPGLPAAYARELVGQATENQRLVAAQTQRVPLDLAQKTRSILRMARMNRALEGLYLDNTRSAESGRLALGLLEGLLNSAVQVQVGEPGQMFTQAFSLELRDGSLAGRTLKTVVVADSVASNRVLVSTSEGYLLYDPLNTELQTSAPRTRSIFEALVLALTPAQLTYLGITGDAQAVQLRQQLSRRLPATHAAVAPVLGWAEQPRWINPGRRLPDGRVGYLLSGDGLAVNSESERTVRQCLEVLYPGADEQLLDEEQARLSQDDGLVFQHLMDLQDDFVQLKLHLDRWVSAELAESRKTVRQQNAEKILRAWQLQAEQLPAVNGQPQGQRLSLGGLQLGVLPELPPHIDFHRLAALNVRDTSVSVVPVDFLRAFSALTELNMSANQLRGLPIGLAYLPQLRVLRLAHNQIRFTAQSVGILQGLTQLTHLDLSFNRLEMLDLSFNHLSRMVSLNLRHCRLGIWPHRIELCGLLEYADLRNNQLTQVPDAVLEMPYAFRRNILVDGNQLRSLQVRKLYALDAIQEHGHLPEAIGAIDPEQVRADWVATVAVEVRPARDALWQTLLAPPASDGLLWVLTRLQKTADFTAGAESQAMLSRGVWELLDALNEDPVLCRQIFLQANKPKSCLETVTDLFSQLRVQVLKAQALTQANAPVNAARPELRAELLRLGRQLFRLEHVERIAHQDAQLRYGGHCDVLTLRLAYRVRLREPLELPAQPYAMTYPESAEVTELSEARVEGALQRVQQAQTVNALAENLSRRDFWQAYLRQQHTGMFDRINNHYIQQIAALQALEPALLDEELHQQTEAVLERKAFMVERLVSALSLSYLHGAQKSGR